MCDIAVAGAHAWPDGPGATGGGAASTSGPGQARIERLASATTDGVAGGASGRYARLSEFVEAIRAIDETRRARVAAIRAAIADGRYDLDRAAELGARRAIGSMIGPSRHDGID